MSVKTSTLAHIYEIQGHKQEAIVIYEEILRKNPNDKQARSSIVRLKTDQCKFTGLNKEKFLLFVNAQSDEDYLQFEEWLTQWN
ncbi:tetratricopeptide repeat protein [Helicobacter fennelliae]|uniref:Tetratricopeptide repeat protein n=2 Tax=Helicobacter fennelliae TaxID=215 RepID=T1CR61_9HELI|nr:tetratricopeptide repeat protein [Helicobacter fennelliae]GAD19244.1 hypothetical protein HFN_0375 [Helicobacter fennelliae MRY12-0050]SQB99027.1 Uncharacterised protein [Helicobacter fennelliae]STP08308.1 Uncharacterised protein [Helicobacter fennelliae]